MKKLLHVLAVLAVTIVAMVGVAIASMTQLPNRSDGGLDWVFNPGGNTYKEGRQIAQGQLTDIAGTETLHLLMPQNGIITAFRTIINNAITTADCVLTVIYNDDVLSDFTHTITQSGSAAGDFDETASLSIQVTKGGKLRVTSDGACNTTTVTGVQVVVDPGDHLNPNR